MLLFGRASNDSCCRHELSLAGNTHRDAQSVLIHDTFDFRKDRKKSQAVGTSPCLLPREVVSNRLPVTLHPDRPPPNDVEQLLLCKHAAFLVWVI